MRFAGTVVSLLCLIQQLGATCSGCGVGGPCQAVCQSSPAHPVEHGCHHDDASAPHEAPADTSETPTHLCSACHVTFLPLAAKVTYEPSPNADWVFVWDATSLLNAPFAAGSARASDSHGPRLPRAALRAELQVFQI